MTGRPAGRGPAVPCTEEVAVFKQFPTGQSSASHLRRDDTSPPAHPAAHGRRLPYHREIARTCPRVPTTPLYDATCIHIPDPARHCRSHTCLEAGILEDDLSAGSSPGPG